MHYLLWLFLSIIGLTGCQNSTGGQFLPYGVPDQPLHHTNRIVILDKNVRDTLFLINSVQERLPGGQIQVKAAFQNSFHEQDVWADVKVEFQDKNSMPIDSGEWITTFFPAAQSTMIESTSLTPNAAKHVVLLKKLRTSDGGNLAGERDNIYAIPW